MVGRWLSNMLFLTTKVPLNLCSLQLKFPFHPKCTSKFGGGDLHIPIRNVLIEFLWKMPNSGGEETLIGFLCLDKKNLAKIIILGSFPNNGRQRSPRYAIIGNQSPPLYLEIVISISWLRICQITLCRILITGGEDTSTGFANLVKNNWLRLLSLTLSQIMVGLELTCFTPL